MIDSSIRPSYIDGLFFDGLTNLNPRYFVQLTYPSKKCFVILLQLLLSEPADHEDFLVLYF